VVAVAIESCLLDSCFSFDAAVNDQGPCAGPLFCVRTCLSIGFRSRFKDVRWLLNLA